MCTIYSTYIKMHKNTQTPSCAPARSQGRSYAFINLAIQFIKSGSKFSAFLSNVIILHIDPPPL